MSKQTVILTKGLIASGKSSWTKEFIHKNQNWKCVNRDSLRHMSNDYIFKPKNEELVQKLWKESVRVILEAGYNLVVDEMNLNKKTLDKNIKFIQSIVPDINIEVKEFKVSLEDAIERDKRRPFSVGEKVIRKTYNRYIREQPEMIKYDPDLPDCAIFDIDGTLAEKGKRNAFDFSKVSEDKVIKPVKEFLNSLNMPVIIFSGRNDSCYAETKEWLNDNNIFYDDLYMRETKDNRKDSIVKKEMYEKYIKGKYNLLFVCDDRKAVIREWQHVNIFTFDVSQDVDNVDEF